jgi:uncharacterized protein YrrD
MIQDNKGVIYYLTKYEGQVMINEINPKSDKIHENIFEIKSDFCLGFSFNNNKFYFMDDFKTVNKLERILDQRKLQEVKVLNLKRKDVPNF